MIDYIKSVWKILPLNIFYFLTESYNNKVYVFSTSNVSEFNVKVVKTQSKFFKISECYITDNIVIGLIVEFYAPVLYKIRSVDSSLAIISNNSEFDSKFKVDQLYVFNLFNYVTIELLSNPSYEILTVLPSKMSVSIL